MKKTFFPNQGIIQALLQTLNKIFQNTKIITIISSCVCSLVSGMNVFNINGIIYPLTTKWKWLKMNCFVKTRNNTISNTDFEWKIMVWKPPKMYKKSIFKINMIIHFKNTEYTFLKKIFSKSRHNTRIITDFEWNIPR